MAPSVVGVGVRTVLDSSHIFVAGDGEDALCVPAPVAYAVAVSERYLKTVVTVGVDVLQRCCGAYHCREVASTTLEEAGTVAHEVVDACADDAVACFEVYTDVEGLGFIPAQQFVGNGRGFCTVDIVAVEDVAGSVAVEVAVVRCCTAAVGIALKPFVVDRAVVAENAVAGPELKLIYETVDIKVAKPWFACDAPAGRYGGEEAPAVALGEFGRAVVAELTLDEVAAVEVIGDTRDYGAVAEVVEVAKSGIHRAYLTFLDACEKIGSGEGEVAVCVEVVAVAACGFIAHYCAYVVEVVECAEVVKCELHHEL